MESIKTKKYFYTVACVIGLATLLTFFTGSEGLGQSERLPLFLLLVMMILAAALALQEGRKLRDARLIVENQILHINSADFQARHSGKSAREVEVYVSCFGILLNSKIIKFNQEGIRLKAVEIGTGYLSLDYGRDTATRSVGLIYAGGDSARLEEVIEKFRYETGIIPTLKALEPGRVLVERIKCKAANCYLLISSQGSVLADAGKPSDVSRIYERVKDKNVRLILLTHGHPDHVGAASALAKLLNVPIAMSKEDVQLLEARSGRTLHSHKFWGRILVLTSKWSLPAVKDLRFSPIIWLEDGRELSEYGVEARVISLPGHTKGSVGVLTSEGDFIVGDALFHIIKPTAAMIYEDRQQMEKSVERIIRSGARYIYVGHGRPFSIQKITQSGDFLYRLGLL